MDALEREFDALFADLNRHVEEGERRIQRQRTVVDLLARAGRETAEAKKLLRTFETLQSLHIAHRDRVLSALTDTDEIGQPSLG